MSVMLPMSFEFLVLGSSRRLTQNSKLKTQNSWAAVRAGVLAGERLVREVAGGAIHSDEAAYGGACAPTEGEADVAGGVGGACLGEVGYYADYRRIGYGVAIDISDCDADVGVGVAAGFVCVY